MLRGSKWVQAQPAGSKWKPHSGPLAGDEEGVDHAMYGGTRLGGGETA